VAYEAAMSVVGAYHNLVLEYAHLRFKVNFGTSACENCDGLHAGPGVAATCYQTQRCEYTNVKEGDVSPKQLRVITSLLEPPKEP
jgi:hypothetical protein